jgi:hypothetical protein
LGNYYCAGCATCRDAFSLPANCVVAAKGERYGSAHRILPVTKKSIQGTPQTARIFPWLSQNSTGIENASYRRTKCCPSARIRFSMGRNFSRARLEIEPLRQARFPTSPPGRRSEIGEPMRTEALRATAEPPALVGRYGVQNPSAVADIDEEVLGLTGHR